VNSKLFLPIPRRSAAVASALAGALLLLPALAHAEGSNTSQFAAYAQKSMPLALAMSLVFGLLASLTPCVWPMVPITVSIFGATDGGSRARGSALSATFVLGIAGLFTPMGVIAGYTGSVMGSALANPYVVGAIVVIFAALSASMFGAFELTLPSGMTNKLSTVGGVGFKGAFSLGLVMGLVAAPCTGPFMTGMLIWIGETKNVLFGSLAMFAFSLGLGVPFFLAGAFAVNLPKGGAWMMGIKWGSGVVLAYMALSYIRDRWPNLFAGMILPSPTFGAIAGVLVIAGIALGGVHIAAERRKSPIAHLSKPTKLGSILPAVLGLFLLLGWTDARKVQAARTEALRIMKDEPPPPNMVFVTDEKIGIAKATAEKKPVLIDFGASWCKACKELEHETFPDPRVRKEGVRFVPISVDATDDDLPEVAAAKKKYDVRGLPTVVLLDSSGKEAARFTEFVKPDAFAAAMAKVH
jgi:thiol:disulfide interchange protein DsbD